MTDQELVARMLAGDKTVSEVLYARHKVFVQNVIQGVCKDPGSAEELLQDVFAKVFQKVDLYDPGKGEFTAWLFTIARNASISHVRRSGSAAKPEDDCDFTKVADESAGSTGSKPLAKDLANSLIRHIEKLKPPADVILIKRLIEGKPFDQIAKLLKKPVDTVKSIFYRQMKALKGRLGSIESEADEY
jgi:RNA polymerase sigma factor (sigma-70 family)